MKNYLVLHVAMYYSQLFHFGHSSNLAVFGTQILKMPLQVFVYRYRQGKNISKTSLGKSLKEIQKHFFITPCGVFCDTKQKM